MSIDTYLNKEYTYMYSDFNLAFDGRIQDADLYSIGANKLHEK